MTDAHTEHVAAAARAARIAVEADVPPRIKHAWLDAVTWFVALPDPAAKKHARFATPDYVATGQGEHEHVVTRAWLRDTVRQHPELAEGIFGLAIACNVTKPEAKLLNRTKGFGWERYLGAGLIVVDTTDDSPLDLDAMAAEQRTMLDRLGLTGG